MHRRTAYALTIAIILHAGPLLAVDSERGKALYETRCVACHDESVHNRAARKATSFDLIRQQVVRWNAELGGAWNQEEIDDVTLYLNEKYYFFPCPPTVCRQMRGSR